MRLWSVWGALALAACQTKGAPNKDSAVLDTPDASDEDGDGYSAADGDCNDRDATISPDALEICDGIDNNCDASVDEGVTTAYYRDDDGDGYGDAGASVASCEAPAGHVAVGNDCDDTSAESHPGAPERCDGEDNDCDGSVDEEVQRVWYADADGDGHGDAGAPLEACDPPAGYVADAGDCDDLDATAFPGGEEVCDEADNDCDGTVDEDVTTTYYRDVDGDGYGVADSTTEGCTRPTGYALDPGDCDDRDAALSPRAAEVCDGVDNDCDATTDEADAVDAPTWYADGDSDGYGDPARTAVACTAPSGHVENNDDCDDATAAASPGEVEVCDGIDNDCDGTADEADAVDAATWYADSDSDGYGTAVSVVACSQPTGFAALSGDCNDATPAANPGEVEVCDLIDNDCDTSVDEGVTTLYYLDYDGDGYGDLARSTAACTVPSGHVENSVDCSDSVAAANPGEVEVCDSIDNDCDGSTDEGVTTLYYQDGDRDGYGDLGRSTAACAVPSGHVENSDDCDDTSADANPGEVEVCDEADNDCDGTTDEGVTSTFYGDADLDGYGVADDETTQACTAPSGYVDNDEDCDDGDADSNPASSEACDDADNDCDGDIDEGVLGDGAACPAESCAEIIADRPSAADGDYYLLPTGSGAASRYTCEMSTDGGGWTLIADWDRLTDGDSLSDFEAEYTALTNNMSRWTSSTGYIEWSDYNATADAMAYKADVIVPNGGELLYDLYFYGYSMEQSGVWFFVVSGGSDQDVLCKENLTTSAYTSAELGYRPGYTCSSSAATTWTWSYAKQQTSFSSEITAFHVHSLMYDSYGDYARLYRLGFWVR